MQVAGSEDNDGAEAGGGRLAAAVAVGGWSGRLERAALGKLRAITCNGTSVQRAAGGRLEPAVERCWGFRSLVWPDRCSHSCRGWAAAFGGGKAQLHAAEQAQQQGFQLVSICGHFLTFIFTFESCSIPLASSRLSRAKRCACPSPSALPGAPIAPATHTPCP